MFYITGDVHCPIDVHKLNTKSWPDQKQLTRNDYLIVCGDMGVVWAYPGSKWINEDKHWQKWFDNKPFTTLFVDGNHENHDVLNNYPVEYWNGGKIHRIKPNLIHLMRGQVYTIDGVKIFTMGGASSHDMHRRKENVDWWKSELPNDMEYCEAIENLEAHNWKVNIIVTHCAPDSVQGEIAYWYEHDKLTNFLEVVVKQDVDYELWAFGHYHIDKDLDDKHMALFNRIVTIDNSMLK